MTPDQFEAEKQELATLRTAWKLTTLMPSDLKIKTIDLDSEKADSADDPILACSET